jgi:HEPN domain-containing protein
MRKMPKIMKREKHKIFEPRENAPKMLAMAKSDLCVARVGTKCECVIYETLCGLCHQSIEKSLKSLTIWNEGYYYQDHSIIKLIDEMEKQQIFLPDEIKTSALEPVTTEGGFSFPLKSPFNFGIAVCSSDYSGDRRYHKPENPITEPDYKKILKRAENIVNWVEHQMQ